VKIFEKIPLTLPSPARGEGFLIPLPRREGLGEGDLGTDLLTFHYGSAACPEDSPTARASGHETQS